MVTEHQSEKPDADSTGVPPWAVLLFGLLSLVCAINISLGGYKNLLLAWQGVQTEAVVREYQCDAGAPDGPSSCTVTYAFQVKTPEGKSQTYEGYDESALRLEPGTKIEIVYLPTAPTVSNLPSQKWLETLASLFAMPIAAIFCLAGVVFIGMAIQMYLKTGWP